MTHMWCEDVDHPPLLSRICPRSSTSFGPSWTWAMWRISAIQSKRTTCHLAKHPSWLVDLHTVFTSGTKSEKKTFAGYGLRVFLRKWMVKHQKHQLCGSLWLFMVPQICWSSSSSSSSQDTWGARLRPGLTFSHLAQLDALGIPVLPNSASSMVAQMAELVQNG